uniref:Uncharacterized protein n=1 Tax=Solanum tuberosum TaxID=4113 RepID=M1DQ00_SOLTU
MGDNEEDQTPKLDNHRVIHLVTIGLSSSQPPRYSGQSSSHPPHYSGKSLGHPSFAFFKVFLFAKRAIAFSFAEKAIAFKSYLFGGFRRRAQSSRTPPSLLPVRNQPSFNSSTTGNPITKMTPDLPENVLLR